MQAERVLPTRIIQSSPDKRTSKLLAQMTKRLSENAMKRLQDIAQTRGGQSDFVKRAQIRPETFRAILSKGHAKDEVVQKIVQALEITASAEIVQVIVCTSYGISAYRLLNGVDVTTREARQVAMMFMKTLSRMSRSAIQGHFGYDDETTVTKGLQSLESRMSVETELRDRVARIKTKIQEAA